MTELKTLKDIEAPKGAYDSYWIYMQSIKQEAIKWVKELESIKVDHRTYGKSPITPDWGYVIQERRGTLLFIKHFFNITEEDLK